MNLARTTTAKRLFSFPFPFLFPVSNMMQFYVFPQEYIKLHEGYKSHVGNT